MSRFQLQMGFDFQQAGKEVIQIEHAALAQLDRYIDADFNRACEKIATCCGKVVVMGMGKSGHIGCKIAATFASTGTSSFFVHAAEACHGDLGMVTSQDIVLAISNSGESKEILALIPLLKRKKTHLICMTNNRDSTIGKEADIHICIRVPQEACPLGLTPTASTTAILVMGDALAVALLKSRGFTPKDFVLSHPGGALGRQLPLRVSDIMRIGDAIPYISADASLRDAVMEITRKKLGMTIIYSNSMNIAGIFTDGDLRRVFNLGINIDDTKIIEIMTPGGVRVHSSMLAADALNLMQRHRITTLLVADRDKLLGVVHLHDTLNAGVI